MSAITQSSRPNLWALTLTLTIMMALSHSILTVAVRPFLRIGTPNPFATFQRSPLSIEQSSSKLLLTTPRGGGITTFGRSKAIPSQKGKSKNEQDDNKDNATTPGTDSNIVQDITQHSEYPKLQSYRMQQQALLNLRGIYLSESLAKRGLPIPTVQDVATPDGSQPPKPVDWDCAMSTIQDPKSCLYSFDAEPNTKVIAPIDTTQWISLSALNRLRRTDPTKVEPMWHSQYAILQSWFEQGTTTTTAATAATMDSPYSLLHHVGPRGILLHELLQGNRLVFVVGIMVTMIIWISFPILEYIFHRLLVSRLLWSRWHQWSRIVHAAFPLKLFLAQTSAKYLASLFDKLVGIIKEQLVELECQLLEETIPLTVGVPENDMDTTLTNSNDHDGNDDDDDDLSSLPVTKTQQEYNGDDDSDNDD